MTAEARARQEWIHEQARRYAPQPLPAKLPITADATNYMAIDRDHVVDLAGVPGDPRPVQGGQYVDLPKAAAALMRMLNCTIGPGDNQDYGSAVGL